LEPFYRKGDNLQVNLSAYYGSKGTTFVTIVMRYKLLIEYDGSRYAGWQLQKKERSIQGELITAVTTVFGQPPVELYGSGRTDAGVHARGQVAHLEIADDRRLRPDQILIKLNSELSHDINILEVEPAHPKFHARFDVKERVYVYEISKRRNAFAKKYVWWVRDPLNIQNMRVAASLLAGFHDFKSFGDVSEPGQSTLVDLHRVDITESEDRIFITISGSHFLWKMVRRIVGVLVEVGRGNMTSSEVALLLTETSRKPAKYTAPPSGLFLQAVYYDK
jgi:tRNA pseudouridine38-40 synthase